MASAMACRTLILSVGIRSVLVNSRACRTYGIRSPGRWSSSIQFGKSFEGFNSNGAKEYSLENQVPDAGRERDSSIRTSSRSADRSSEEGSSNEISYFEPESEWMQSDSMDDSGWYHDMHEKSPVNVSSRSGIKDLNKAKEDAGKVAVQWLAKRAFTAAELTKKLHGKNYPLEIIESVIDELKSRGFLNDGLYAESFSRSRWASLNWGPQRIKQALRQKGVDESSIERALDLVFKDDSAKSGFLAGISEISMDRLFDQASKQWLRSQTSPLTNRRARMVRWLQYRGFDWSVTSFILKKLESKCPP